MIVIVIIRDSPRSPSRRYRCILLRRYRCILRINEDSHLKHMIKQQQHIIKAYDKTAAAYNKKCYIKQQQHIIKNAIKCKSNRLCGSALLSGVTRYTRSILHPQSLLSIQINGCFLSLLYKGIYISVLGREFIFICCF